MKKKNKRIFTLVFFLSLLFTGTTIIFYNLRDNIVFFYSPTEIHTSKFNLDNLIRLGGMVKEESVNKSQIEFKGKNVEEVSFIVTDFENEVKVKFIGILPDLFKEGQGVVVEGRLDKNYILTAKEVLAKHDENYMPPEIKNIESIKDRVNDI
jgi:cytochrome c-type biogenesis protein CcmE